MADDFLAKILVERQLISGDEANRLLRVADSKHCFLEQVLLKEQVYSRAQLFQILENHFFCTAVDLQDWPFNPRLLTIFPQKLASQHLVFPVDYAGEGLKVAMANPDDICARDAVTCNDASLPYRSSCNAARDQRTH